MSLKEERQTIAEAFREEFLNLIKLKVIKAQKLNE